MSRLSYIKSEGNIVSWKKEGSGSGATGQIKQADWFGRDIEITVNSKINGKLKSSINFNRGSLIDWLNSCGHNIEKGGWFCGGDDDETIIKLFNTEMEKQKVLDGKAAAAVDIQKYFRSYLVRKPLLSGDLHADYHAQCIRVQGPEFCLIPRAPAGDTPVYLPKEMPEVVLKKSGREEAIKRFHQMQNARSTLDSQNSSHLIIPKANLCKDFIVEERLPINIDSYHNMHLYISQPQLFDEAVRELTRLFSKGYLGDLVGPQDTPLGHIEGVKDFVRYDNLPLYIIEEDGKKQGKIGLIDLEHFSNGPSSQGLATLVRIFPYHLDVIKEEAHMLKMLVDDIALAAYAEKGKQYLKIGFIDHHEWLKDRSGFANIPFQVSPEREKELIHCVEEELLKLNQGINDVFTRQGHLSIVPGKDFLNEELAKSLAMSITPLIIANLQKEIEIERKKELDKISEQSMTESALVNLRSPVITRSKLFKGVENILWDELTVDDFCDRKEVAEQLTYIVLEKLVNTGEIFSFDPGYYGRQSSWIRY